ncbi:MAG TPA: IS4 family transposase [Pirellulaceae bacterium]|jgi:hypothetical protein|nr:IS4 family transposase [Pirellulaceae bacterium]
MGRRKRTNDGADDAVLDVAAEGAGLEKVQIQGLRKIRSISRLLAGLRDEGRQRDKAGNRELFLDRYCGLLLLSYFSPAMDSLRKLEQASGTAKVQKLLGCKKTSRAALSEAASHFDSEAVEGLFAELVEKIPRAALPPDLKNVHSQVVAVDGSLLATLPQIAGAALGTNRGVRLHVHFEIFRGTPIDAEITNGSNGAKANEKASLRRLLQSDRLYVVDRGYVQFSLFNAIVRKKSSYVCRLRQDQVFETEETRELSPAARAAGVQEDAVGRLGSLKSVRIERPDHCVRRVVFQVDVAPRRKKTAKKGAKKKPSPPTKQTIEVVTNLLDVPVETIATLYRHRWKIELFFRWLKCTIGLSHLFSRSPEGLRIQVYCALVACLLVHLIAGRKPTELTFSAVSLYVQGWMTEAELVAHLRTLSLVETLAS